MKYGKMVFWAAIANVVYFIWRNRNMAYWDKMIMSINKATLEIKCIVKNRIVQIMGAKIKESDRKWIYSL